MTKQDQIGAAQAIERIAKLPEHSLTLDEAVAVVEWCREWVSDTYPLAYLPPTALLLRGCENQIEGGLAFVLEDVRRYLPVPETQVD